MRYLILNRFILKSSGRFILMNLLIFSQALIWSEFIISLCLLSPKSIYDTIL